MGCQWSRPQHKRAKIYELTDKDQQSHADAQVSLDCDRICHPAAVQDVADMAAPTPSSTPNMAWRRLVHDKQTSWSFTCCVTGR
jgi:hypothetical protein